jgi:hypothetical protein
MWQCAACGSVFIEDHERRYREVFQHLRDNDILRSAFLRRGDEMVHTWPDEESADARPPDR